MLKGSEILFPVDFSDRCVHAAESVRALAERVGASITVLHVISWPRTFIAAGDSFATPELGSYTLPLDVDAIREDRTRLLSKFIAGPLKDNAVQQMIQCGDPASVIVEYAQQKRVAMIMMPTRGKGRFRRFLLGSVTAKVLHDVECPVWTDAHTEEPAHAGGHPVHKVLCAIEIEKRRMEVLKWAAALTGSLSAELVVTHIVGAHEAYRTEDDPNFGAFLKDTARAQIEEMLSQACIQARVVIEGGRTAQTIHAVAEAEEADLLVIGRGCLPSALGRLRTHAYSIIRESPCPVISV